MATWGSYFSSYVKKTSDAKQVELEELNEKELLSKSNNGPKRIESGSSQKSVKKLYDLVEDPQSYQPKRSASNAARVAKMFGYGTPAPEVEVKDEPVAPIATWTKIEPVAPLSLRKKVDNTPATVPTPAPAPVLPSFMKRFGTAVPPAPAPPAPEKVESKPLPSKPLPAAPAKPKSKQDIFAMLDDFASFADNPDSIQILPDLPAKKPVVAELRLQTKNIAPRDTKENYRPTPARKDSFWSDTDSPASYRSSRKDSLASFQSQVETPASSVSSSSFRKNSFQSQLSPLLSRPKLVVAKNISLEPSEDFRARMMDFERQSEELKREQQRRDEEREQILKYERMQDQMRYEREKMEMEREKMMEEQRRFQEEEDRLAEEEKQMASFMKNFQVEMERDRENEERKRRAAEEAERERLRAIEAEERRIREEQEEEERRQQAEIEAEERRQREAEEAEERRLQEIRDKEEEERELREYEARRAQRQREAEEKERRLRLKDERLAQEEADRLTALALREAKEADRRKNAYAEELEADRRRFEAEQEEEERRRAEDEEFERQGQRRFIAERAERERLEREREEREKFEQEEAERERQRAKDERIETQRRVAEERAQRAQFEEDESRRIAQEKADRRFEAERRQQEEESDDDRPLTKEEEMAKAEEKIRQAFAGLAKEKGQNVQPIQRSNTVAIQMPRPMAPVKNYARGITPAGRESRVYKGESEQPKADRVLGRNNTVAAFGAKPGPVKKPGVLQKPPRAPGGSVGNIGLPGGPRSGLPSGPGPRRNQTTRR